MFLSTCALCVHVFFSGPTFVFLVTVGLCFRVCCFWSDDRLDSCGFLNKSVVFNLHMSKLANH